ncbi:hypothetical protein MRX96_031315 [Rhipicephalus microplus]
MADVDIQRLCSICHDLPPEHIAAMEAYFYPFLNPSILELYEDPLYGCIKDIEREHERVQSMAMFYSWILRRSLQTPWALYGVHRMRSVLDAPQIARQMVRKVRSTDRRSAEWLSESDDAWCVTIMTTQGARSPSTHIPISIHVWLGLPFVAIHVQDMAGSDTNNQALFESIVGGLERCFYGFYPSLASARSACHPDRRH